MPLIKLENSFALYSNLVMRALYTYFEQNKVFVIFNHRSQSVLYFLEEKSLEFLTNLGTPSSAPGCLSAHAKAKPSNFSS